MRNSKLFHSGMAGIATLGMLAALSPAAMADTSSSSTQTMTWTVDAGPSLPSGLMAMSFFPNVITIDAGDTVTFKGSMHTVTFPGPDGKFPSSASPQAQMPAGGNTYDGSVFTSSGMLTDTPYSLTFTKPGVYPYYCLLHPGMMGVVIVNPTGTQYPMTQEQYNAVAEEEEQADYNAGNQSVNTFQLQSKKNTNGTTTYYAQTDVQEPQTYSFNLTSQNGSFTAGTALVAFAQPPAQTDPDITYRVDAKLSGLTPGQTYTAVLSEGKSGSGVTVPNSQFESVTVNSDGTGTVSGSVKAPGLPQGIWYLDVYDTNHNVVASGIINHTSFAYERYLPATLHIHSGDSVVWAQTGTNELHTVTFLPKGWKDIPSENMMPAPYGGHIDAGSGFFNSGFLVPGATYELTFTKSGNYQYRCLLHDFMGMYGNVDVTHQAGTSTFTLNDTILDVPSQVKDGTTFVPLYGVQQILKSSGIQSTWDGHNWKVATSNKVNLGGIQSNHGIDHFYINGKLVQSANSFVSESEWHNNATTYVPLYNVEQALQAIGLRGTWDGGTWDLTPNAHAGSVPGNASTTK